MIVLSSVAKTKVLISCAVTMQLFCTFVFEYIQVYAKPRFSHDVNHFFFAIRIFLFEIYNICSTPDGPIHGHQSSSVIAKYNDNKFIGGTSYYELGGFDLCKKCSLVLSFFFLHFKTSLKNLNLLARESKIIDML